MRRSKISLSVILGAPAGETSLLFSILLRVNVLLSPFASIALTFTFEFLGFSKTSTGRTKRSVPLYKNAIFFLAAIASLI
jgi:hypothetical protein